MERALIHVACEITPPTHVKLIGNSCVRHLHKSTRDSCVWNQITEPTCSSSVSETVDRNDIWDRRLVSLGLFPPAPGSCRDPGGHAGFTTTFPPAWLVIPSCGPEPSIYQSQGTLQQCVIYSVQKVLFTTETTANNTGLSYYMSLRWTQASQQGLLFTLQQVTENIRCVWRLLWLLRSGLISGLSWYHIK